MVDFIVAVGQKRANDGNGPTPKLVGPTSLSFSLSHSQLVGTTACRLRRQCNSIDSSSMSASENTCPSPHSVKLSNRRFAHSMS